jgi:NAD(P)-dependent dehydrogenase (short-subunit alcohol dehydrogenase family)
MSTRAIPRRKAIITGAAGGMGQACSRKFGATMDLVLTDVAGDSLDTFAQSLKNEGYTVSAVISGDLTDRTVAARLADAGSAGAGLGALVHTAAISQIMASWAPILTVNVIGTATLLAAIEPVLQDGTVAVLIASMAGHMSPIDAEADRILDDPFAPDFLDRIGPLIEAFGQDDSRGSSPVAYALAKRTTMRICEQRAPAWAEKGARIASISPGMIWTPMGQREVAGNANAASVVEATPVGRWGTGMDIAAAAWFLASEAAGFITGTDLRVDGGVTPVMIGRKLAAAAA